MPDSSRTTLRDIAAVAGVSVGTVSQALRGKGSTGRKTQARIRQLAEEMGYVPDPLMAQMGSRSRLRDPAKTALPILVAVSRRPGYDASHIDARMERAIVESTRDHGYFPWLREVWSRDELRRQLREFYWKGGRGLLLWDLHEPTWLDGQDWDPFSVVLLGGRHYFPRFHTVECDATLSYARALEGALATESTVGVIRHYHRGETVLDDITRAGVESAFRQQTRIGAFVPTLKLGFHEEEARSEERVAAWWRRHQPEVVVGFPLGYSLLARCGEARQVRFIHCDGRDSDHIEEGICEPVEEICRQAVERLEGMIRRQETGQPKFPSISSLPPIWIERATTPKGAG